MDARKLRDYVLNPNHATGRHKARWFRAALGIGPAEAEMLAAQIVAGAAIRPVIERETDEYGRRFSIDILVEGPQAIAYVKTAWIVEHGRCVPRLASAYGGPAHAVRLV